MIDSLVHLFRSYLYVTCVVVELDIRGPGK